ncbi:MAG TPA: acetate--CoA ligase family protein, partial [Limnochordia bacterium]
MSSQSGALGLAIIEYARELGLGLSSFVSVGNKADVSGNDLIQYWEDDPDTSLILLYLESFGNPRRFARLARRVARKKPILAVKSGRSSAGRRAAGSHTAALAASDVATAALFKQAGVIRVDTLEEMFEVASFLAHQPIPAGNRVAILTNAGGPGILCADACEAAGLELPDLSDEAQAALRAFLPPTASVTNPVDMIASAGAEDYERALPILLDDPSVDAVITIFIPTGIADTERVSASIKAGRQRARTGRSKPLLACFMGHQGMTSPLADAREAVPSYRFPESAARALGKAAEYGTWLRRPHGVIPLLDGTDVKRARAVCDKVLTERGDGWLLPDEVNEILDAFSVPRAPSRLCRTAAEAAAAARELGFPVAVKLASATLVHKTEWKGVHLDLDSPAAVEAAFRRIAQALEAAGRLDAMAGVTVQPMVKDGVEVMIGVTEDPSFGPLVAFGLGGVTVELLGDVVFRITPLTDQDAVEMVRGIRGYKLLDGYRGAPKADQQALVDILLRVSHLVEEVPQVAELDFNPVKVLDEGRGAVVLDARVMVRLDR